MLPAFGDEQAAGFDTSRLVHVNAVDYTVDYDSSVSKTPIAQSRIKKIEKGQVSYVDIITTSTGTYSTDGLFSNNVKYPGIEVNRVPAVWTGAISSWGGTGQWITLPLLDASSITWLRAGANMIMSARNFTCIHTPFSWSC